MTEPEAANPQPAKIRRQYDELETMRRVDDLLNYMAPQVKRRILAWLNAKNDDAPQAQGSQQHLTIDNRFLPVVRRPSEVRIEEDDGA
jgi:hypothetical protein